MKSMSQNEYVINNGSQITPDEDEGKCTCEKKQCMLGIASIVIGVGGFVLAFLL